MSLHHDPEQFQEERTRLIAEIEDVFNRVSREGGVSWAESIVIDDFGTKEEQIAARSRDTDRHWTDLLDAPEWSPEAGLGGFSFLDPIGFRYYLPAAMVEILGSNDPYSTFHFHLTLSAQDSQSRAYSLAQWSALNDAQCRCVARFLRFMIQFSESMDEEIAADGWREALTSYWNDVR